VQHTGKFAIWIVSVLLLACGFGSSAFAATFKVHCSEEDRNRGDCTIVMQGRIEKGDSERLVQALKSPSPTFIRTLVLHSPGGEVQAAFELADVIVGAVLNTQTFTSLPGYQIEDSFCVSACFLAWIAGAERYQVGMYFPSTRSNNGLGLHRPYFSPESFAKLDPVSAQRKQQELTSAVRAHLKRYDISDALTEQMMSRSSKDVFWITLNDPIAEKLSGKAAWFEELMIAKCNFDPVYESESDKQMFEFAQRNIKNSPAQAKYMSWLRTYGQCASTFRYNAQKKFLASR
jgi:hypothetical protein